MSIAPITGTNVYPLSINEVFPSDLIIKVLSYLPVSQVLECRRLSNAWKQLADSSSLWRLLFARDFLSKEVSSHFQENYKKETKRERLISHNLRKCNFYATVIDTPIGHDQMVTCIGVKEDLFAYGFLSGRIEIWQLGSRMLVLDQCHSSVVSSFFFCECDKLISAAPTKEVKVWDLKMGSCLHTFNKGLEDEATRPCNVSHLVSYAWQKIHDLELPRNSRVLSMTKGGLCLIEYPREESMELLHITFCEGKKLEAKGRKLEGALQDIRACILWEETVITGTLDGYIRVWNTATGLCEKTIKACFNSSVMALTRVGDRDLMFSACEDEESESKCAIQLWDTRTWKCIKTWKHRGARSLSFSSGSLILRDPYKKDVRSNRHSLILWHAAPPENPPVEASPSTRPSKRPSEEATPLTRLNKQIKV
jgi:WD40 repeat protein